MTITRPIPEPPLPIWEDELFDTKLEADLRASIENTRRADLPRDLATAHPTRPVLVKEQQHHQTTSSASETLSASTLTGLISGCGVAVIDGYLAMKDYAAAKGLDLAELHHKGIDLQDLISTLVIHVQRTSEIESREAGARRYKR